MDQSIHERLKMIRHAAGLSQTEFADICGLTQQRITQYETGKRTPKMTTIDSMIKAVDQRQKKETQAGDAEKADICFKIGANLLQLSIELFHESMLQREADLQRQEGAELEDIKKALENRERKDTDKLIAILKTLNNDGRYLVVNYAEDLAGNPKYQAAAPDPGEE